MYKEVSSFSFLLLCLALYSRSGMTKIFVFVIRVTLKRQTPISLSHQWGIISQNQVTNGERLYQNMVISDVQFLIKFKLNYLTTSIFQEKKKKKKEESKYCCCWPKSIIIPRLPRSTMAPQNQHITEIRHLALVREDN